jgi:hypothetical protein
MSVAQKSNFGRSAQTRLISTARDMAYEAVAQAQRQLDFEREHKDAIIKLASEELRACERRITVLTKHIADLKELTGQVTASGEAA